MPWVKIIGAVAALALAFLAGSEFTARGKDAEIADIRRAAAVDQVKATDRARAEEHRRTQEQSRIANEAKEQREQALADARAADAVAGQLRKRVAELSPSRASHPAAASGGEAAGDPIGVLADVLSRADRRAGILAEYADAARIAGQACERAYDTLSRSDALHR